MLLTTGKIVIDIHSGAVEIKYSRLKNNCEKMSKNMIFSGIQIEISYFVFHIIEQMIPFNLMYCTCRMDA